MRIRNKAVQMGVKGWKWIAQIDAKGRMDKMQ